MAMKPAAASPPPDDDEDEDDTGAGGDTGGDTGGDDTGDDSDAPGDEDVLLTVVKESDGTYSLIKGDEEDASGADAAGSADASAPGADSGKQSFDSPGPLLKAILDILQEDQSAGTDGGSADDQFQAGFSGAGGAPGATGGAGGAGASMPQKY